MTMRNAPFIKYTCGFIIDMAIQESDSELQERRKVIMIITHLVGFILGILVLTTKREEGLSVIAGVITLVQSSIVLVYIVVLKHDVCQCLLSFIAIATCFSISIADLPSVALGHARAWSIFIVLTDILLLCQADENICKSVIIFCCVYLIVIASEVAFRYGLLDFDWDAYSQIERKKRFDCELLPCAKGVSESGVELMTQIFIFCIDFMCTRGFARGMLEEQNRVLASIRTANEIATSLAGFDLIQAGVLLEESKIPPELRVAFEKLLNNLHTYAPYLPPSCIPRGAEFYSPANSEVDTQPTIVLGDPIEERSVTINQFVKKPFQQCNASLMVININNSMSVLDHSLESFEKLISALVSTTFDNVMKYKGTPDLFLGDRMFANFGASLQRSRHAHACFDCCTEVLKSSASLLDPFQELTSKRLSINVGTATGQIACGDLGSDTMLRFSLVGKLSQWVAVIERVGSFLGIQFLSNENFHKQVTETTESRVILQPVKHLNETQLIFEVIPTQRKLENSEWMYQMQQSGVGKWDAFNIVAAALLRNKPIPKEYMNIPHGVGVYYEQLRNVINYGISYLCVRSWEIEEVLTRRK